MDNLTQTDSVNLGLVDGLVEHHQINRAVARADKVVLFGEQTRLPYFPTDQRLAKLHAGDERVLAFRQIVDQLPQNLREALLARPLSVVLVRDSPLLYWENWRTHQGLHVGLGRRALYLPEGALERSSSSRGMWALVEGLVYGLWLCLDFVLLADMIRALWRLQDRREKLQVSGPLLRRLSQRPNLHRREHMDAGLSEVEEWLRLYEKPLAALDQGSDDLVLETAVQLYDRAQHGIWAREKVQRLARIWQTAVYCFEQEIMHRAAAAIATERGEDRGVKSFDDALHDYRDARRFEPMPLLTKLGKSRMSVPRADLLRSVVELGLEGLRGFWTAYSQGAADVVALAHPLWSYLCALSSDPAGVFVRAGRCRVLARQRRLDEIDPLLAGILLRLDLATNYQELSTQALSLGPQGRNALEEVVSRQGLDQEDEWAAFKLKKQTIVNRARDLLEAGDLSAVSGLRVEAAPLHEDEQLNQVLDQNPHRHTSDPSGVLRYRRAYLEARTRHGAIDGEVNYLLASLVIRLDRSFYYRGWCGRLLHLGPPAVEALCDTLEQISPGDQKRLPIRRRAHRILAEILRQYADQVGRE